MLVVRYGAGKWGERGRAGMVEEIETGVWEARTNVTCVKRGKEVAGKDGIERWRLDFRPDPGERTQPGRQASAFCGWLQGFSK